MSDLKLEFSILGAIINDEPNKVIAIQKINKKEFFEYKISQYVFSAIYDLFINQSEVDFFTVKDRLIKNNHYQQIGDDVYSEITSNTLSLPTLELRIEVLKKDYLYRVQVDVAKDILNKAQKGEIPPDELILEAINSLESSLYGENIDTSKPVGILLKDMMLGLLNESEKELGYTTGYKEIDDYFTLLPGTLVTFAARSSAGKTAFLLQVLRRLSFLNNIPCAVFSLEMRASAYVTRITSAHLKINSYAFRNNLLGDKDKDRFHNFVTTFSASPLFIDDNPEYDVHSILAKIIVLAITKHIKVFAIDYLTLVKLHYETKQTTKSDAIGYFTFALKKIARKLNVTIIILQQLNKELDKRPNPRPIIGDLKDSGSIENDSDVVVLFYRPDMYTQNIFEARSKDERDTYGHLEGKYFLLHKNGRNITPIEMSNKCEENKKKNREGKTGSLFFDFIKGYGGFDYNNELSSILNNKKNESNTNNTDIAF